MYEPRPKVLYAQFTLTPPHLLHPPQLQPQPHMQAIMEAWVADTNNQQQHQEEIQRHQALVDAKASSVQQLLINVAQLARQQQHVAHARQRGA